MAIQRKADSFRTFLQTVQGKTTDSSPQVRVLQVLLSSGPMPIPKIVTATDLEISTFLETLESLRGLHLIAVDNDVVALTPTGKELAEGAGRQDPRDSIA